MFQRSGAISVLVIAMALLGLAAPPASWAHDGDERIEDAQLTISSTRDLGFGRVTASAAGAIRVSAQSHPVAQPSGGVSIVAGGETSSARFVIQNQRNAPPGTVVVVTLPQTIQVRVSGETLIAENVEAALDDAGQDWASLGAGRYRCTLTGAGRCAFVVGATLRLPRFGEAGQGVGALRASVVTLGAPHGEEDHDEHD